MDERRSGGNFGIKSEDHLGALQYAVLYDGVSAEQLDAAFVSGPELQKLVSDRNPYRLVTFETVWDRCPASVPAGHHRRPIDD